jgi:hypothetical protein
VPNPETDTSIAATGDARTVPTTIIAEPDRTSEVRRLRMGLDVTLRMAPGGLCKPITTDLKKTSERSTRTARADKSQFMLVAPTLLTLKVRA